MRKQFSSPAGLVESLNGSFKSLRNSQMNSTGGLQSQASQHHQQRRAGGSSNAAAAQISSVRTQLSLEKKKVQDLNNCVMSYKDLKENSDGKLNASLDELRATRDKLSQNNKDMQNSQYRIEYLERENIRLLNQNKQLKAYINKLENSLKTVSQNNRMYSQQSSTSHRNANSNASSRFIDEKTNNNNNTNTMSNSNSQQQTQQQNNLHQSHNISAQLNTSNISQTNNISKIQVHKIKPYIHSFSLSSIHLLNNYSNISTSKETIHFFKLKGRQKKYTFSNLIVEREQSHAYAKKLENDVRSYQEEIKILTKALEINSPQGSIKRNLNESGEETYQRRLSHLARDLAETKDAHERSTNAEADLREKLVLLNAELEKAFHQIEEYQVLKEADSEEILRLENRINVLQSQQNSAVPTNTAGLPPYASVSSASGTMKTPSSAQQSTRAPGGTTLSTASSPVAQGFGALLGQRNPSLTDQIQDDQQREAIRILTEQVSQAHGIMNEQNLQLYSEEQKRSKQIEELQTKLVEKELNVKQSMLKVTQVQLELEATRQKLEKVISKKDAAKQNVKQLEQLNLKLVSSIKKSKGSLSALKDEIFTRLGFDSTKENIEDLNLAEEIEYLVSENDSLREAVEQSVNKYTQAALLCNDLKIEINKKDAIIERQIEHKSAVQSTLVSQMYTLRNQNTDLQEANSLIRREHAAFLESLQTKKPTKKKGRKSQKKSNRSNSPSKK